MTSRKLIVWAWIVYPLLAVVLYVLSFGPACGLVSRTDHPVWHYRLSGIISVIYAPVKWVLARSRSSVNATAVWYLRLWLQRSPPISSPPINRLKVQPSE